MNHPKMIFNREPDTRDATVIPKKIPATATTVTHPKKCQSTGICRRSIPNPSSELTAMR